MDGSDIALLLTIVFYVFCCPYSKVEESFNMQAFHDLSEFGFVNLSNFDHLQFPGVVPRTFIGPILVSLFSVPFLWLLKLFAAPSFYAQIVCRIVLGLISWLSFIRFKNGASKRFGERSSQLISILIICQFHICFYMSRSLPNIFALSLCNVGFGYWLEGKAEIAILIIATAMCVFRCDIAVLLAPLVIQLLISGEITFFRSLFQGLATVLTSISISVCIDSWFWKKYLWPEGIVLFFNTVENRSSEWGVMPVHWYFSNALPRALHVCIPWILIGILGIKFPVKALSSDEQSLSVGFLKKVIVEAVTGGFFLNKKVAYYSFPAVAFVLLYSILPHKELRFIFPAIPLLSLAGGVGLDSILPPSSSLLWYPLNLLSEGKDGKLIKKESRKWTSSAMMVVHLINAAVLLSFFAAVLIDSTLLSAAQHNYPGAVALERLIHAHIPLLPHHVPGSHQDTYLHHRRHTVPAHNKIEPIFVHIDAAAAMTGVTRFLQERISLDGRVRPASLKLNWLSSTSPSAEYLNFDRRNFDFKAFYNCVDLIESESEEDLGVCGDMDLVYYSKREDETDFSHYDFLITAEPPEKFSDSGLFHVAEQIKGFSRLRLSKWGIQVELKTVLYILINHSKNNIFAEE